MAGRKRRNLSQADREIWQKVADTTNPLRLEGSHPSAKLPARPSGKKITKPAITAKPASEVARPAREPMIPEGHAADLAMPSGDTLDRRRYDRLRRGKMTPQARIDLHGMTAARAHPELVEFVLRTHAQGLRLVLVITGKGSARADEDSIMPPRRGILRHSVPHWLTRPPLGPLILQVTSAHARHGGGGAFYVYLRRARG